MPVKEFSKSMKAKMYDFTYTPFMSSMVIAWIILNHKYILIYMSSYDLDKKLELLKNYDFILWDIPYMFNAILPISFGLFYTFLYPWLSQLFYSYTLNRNKTLKTIKTQVEDNTPITQEEAKFLKKENYEKTEKILDLEDKVTSIRSDYDMKITTIESDTKNKITTELNKKHKKQIKELQKNYEKEHREKEKTLEEKYQNAYNSIVEERDNLASVLQSNQTKNTQLIKENKELLQKIPKESINKKTDEEKILRYFYESNYSKLVESDVLNNIVITTKIPRPKVQVILNKLIKEEILLKDNTYDYIDITEKGNHILIKLFDKETKK